MKNKYFYLIIIGVIFLLGIIYFKFLKTENNDSFIMEEDITFMETTSSLEVSAIKKIYVDIKGAINNPGVYEMNEGDKVIDVINKAGGLNKSGVTDNINLSKKVTDEMVIYIFTKKELTTTNNQLKENISRCTCETITINNCLDNESEEKSKTNNPSNIDNSKININTGGKEELTKITGIGEAKADAIIDYRSKNGLFTKIEDIKNVSGFGDSLYEKIKDYITV